MPPNLSQKIFSIQLLKAILLLIAGFVGGFAAFLADFESITTRLKAGCIKYNICPPGDHFVDVNIATLEVSADEVKQISPIKDIDPADVLASYSLEFRKNPEADRLRIQPIGSVTGQGYRNGLPYHVAPELGYWAPEEFWDGWPLGYPILDVIVAEKGKKIDITNIEISVLKAESDESPYVQIVAPSDNFGSVTLVNESVHDLVSVTMDFNILESFDADCYGYEMDEASFDNFSYHLSDISVHDSSVVDLSQFLEKEVADFRYRKFRNLIAIEHNTYSYSDGIANDQTLPSPPAGYVPWEVSNPYLDPQPVGNFISTRAIYGKITSSSKTANYESFFCASVPIEPPEGLGGGAIGFSDVSSVNLILRPTPYEINYDIKYRLDEEKPHFRTALMFSSEESGRFEIRFKIKSFDRVVYESDIIELNTFVPKTTMAFAKGEES